MADKPKASPVWRQQNSAQKAIQQIADSDELDGAAKLAELVRLETWLGVQRRLVMHQIAMEIDGERDGTDRR